MIRCLIQNLAFLRLSALKIEYDRFFKDKISTKPPEIVSAALKSLENDVIAVKVRNRANELSGALTALVSRFVVQKGS